MEANQKTETPQYIQTEHEYNVEKLLKGIDRKPGILLGIIALLIALSFCEGLLSGIGFFN